jgi:5-formyltetrahydrofolate cyclo-ligase
MQGEVRTDAIIEQCWQENKRVCVPAYRAETNHYDFVTLDRDAPMVVGPARILEPEAKQWIPADEVDLALVPGVAFDSLGGRLGHGGGHYDRILGRVRSGTPFTAGLAFEFQVYDRVPTNESDVRMDVVVTEKRVIRAQSAEGAR